MITRIENNIEYTKTHWQTKLSLNKKEICWIEVRRIYQDQVYHWQLYIYLFFSFSNNKGEIERHKLINDICEILNIDIYDSENTILTTYYDNSDYLEKPFKDKELIINYLKQEYE